MKHQIADLTRVVGVMPLERDHVSNTLQDDRGSQWYLRSSVRKDILGRGNRNVVAREEEYQKSFNKMKSHGRRDSKHRKRLDDL